MTHIIEFIVDLDLEKLNQFFYARLNTCFFKVVVLLTVEICFKSPKG